MDKIFWVDMEMTGLDPEEHAIIEIAGIISDLNFKPLDQYHAVVFQPPEELAKMDDWNVTTHSQSGLLEKIPHGKPLNQVEQQVLAFLEPHFLKEPPVLAGNSIHQDRKFIDRYMPNLAKRLHYRMIDVSSFKMIFKHVLGVSFPKIAPHRAIEDIEASINELRFYTSHFKPVAGDQP